MSSQDRLIDAAEKLVALKGEAGAANRAIILEAGQRHNSAITYHFGSRRALFAAVWDRRSAAVDRHRAPMLEALGSPSLEDLVEVYVRPLATYLDDRAPSYWARFNEESLRRYPLQLTAALRTNLQDAPAEVGLLTVLDVLERLQKLTCDGVEPAAALRVAQMARMVITTFAAWERERDRSTTDLSARQLGAQLVPGVLGLLRAPS
ncbi:regulatory protein, tetR family [Friedmanniella luteola]|uniref:Regulatory protein, tetR family n=1 Tax=Friedmanniella luteola TaxID=546871 RepID=A0A1H1RSM0_9ACTN|nr:TetR family transcriptional regulator [Friedmanniella luteola]SDS38721.1 regulatory protein, tetR family [Friedmanniella luteola]